MAHVAEGRAYYKTPSRVVQSARRTLMRGGNALGDADLPNGRAICGVAHRRHTWPRALSARDVGISPAKTSGMDYRIEPTHIRSLATTLRRVACALILAGVLAA